MAVIGLVPLTEAATFTLGCVLLRTCGLDQDRVGAALGSTIVLLFVSLLIVLTPDSLAIDADALDPAGIWSALPGGSGTR